MFNFFKKKPTEPTIQQLVNEYRAKKIANRISHSWIPRIDTKTGKLIAIKRSY